MFLINALFIGGTLVGVALFAALIHTWSASSFL